ncbi:MAG: cupin domain-containing protein [Saprospiraceae bacterium]|nr:cupin domain-containing protein [Pyrinomonadaceae bacterium]
MAGIYRFEKWKEYHAPNPAMLHLMMERAGFKVQQWCENAYMLRGNTKHPEDRLHWVVSGSLELTIDKVGVVLLTAGDQVLLPAETYYSFRVAGDCPAIYMLGLKIEKAVPIKKAKRKSGSKKDIGSERS